MSLSKTARLGIVIGSIIAGLAVIGVVTYVLLLPELTRQNMTFEKLRPLTVEYQSKHVPMSYERQDATQVFAKSSTNTSTFSYERSNEYVHIKTENKSYSTTTSERYVLKSRPLVVRQSNDGPIEAFSTTDKTLNGGAGYKGYDETVASYRSNTEGVIELFSKPTFTYKNGLYYLDETRTVGDIFPHFETGDFFINLAKKDTRKATIKAVVDATSSALVSYTVAIVPTAEDAPVGQYYTETITVEGINYKPAAITLPDEYKAALSKE